MNEKSRPVSRFGELIRRLEQDYDFQCEAGPLKLCDEWQQLVAAASEKPAHVPGRSLPPKPFPGIVKEWLGQWGDIAPMRTADLWDRIVAMQEET